MKKLLITLVLVLMLSGCLSQEARTLITQEREIIRSMQKNCDGACLGALQQAEESLTLVLEDE